MDNEKILAENVELESVDLGFTLDDLNDESVSTTSVPFTIEPENVVAITTKGAKLGAIAVKEGAFERLLVDNIMVEIHKQAIKTPVVANRHTGYLKVTFYPVVAGWKVKPNSPLEALPIYESYFKTQKLTEAQAKRGQAKLNENLQKKFFKNWNEALEFLLTAVMQMTARTLPKDVDYYLYVSTLKNNDGTKQYGIGFHSDLQALKDAYKESIK